MAADSMTYVRDESRKKVYAAGNKLFEIPGMPIAIMTYGLGGLGRRTIGSLLEEWIESRPAYGDDYTVEQVAHDVVTWVFQRHRAYRREVERILEAQRAELLAAQEQEETSDLVSEAPEIPEFIDWTTGLIIGGYQPGSFYSWLWEYEEPTSDPDAAMRLKCTRAHDEHDESDDGPPEGLNWWGNSDALRRLVNGYDPRIIGKLSVDEGAFSEACEDLRWNVLHEGMPTQDAVDYARFLLDVGTGYEKFQSGEPTVGGHVDIAVVHRRGVHWVSRKPLSEALSRLVIQK